MYFLPNFVNSTHYTPKLLAFTEDSPFFFKSLSKTGCSFFRILCFDLILHRQERPGQKEEERTMTETGKIVTSKMFLARAQDWSGLLKLRLPWTKSLTLKNLLLPVKTIAKTFYHRRHLSGNWLKFGFWCRDVESFFTYMKVNLVQRTSQRKSKKYFDILISLIFIFSKLCVFFRKIIFLLVIRHFLIY